MTEKELSGLYVRQATVGNLYGYERYKSKVFSWNVARIGHLMSRTLLLPFNFFSHIGLWHTLEYKTGLKLGHNSFLQTNLYKNTSHSYKSLKLLNLLFCNCIAFALAFDIFSGYLAIYFLAFRSAISCRIIITWENSQIELLLRLYTMLTSFNKESEQFLKGQLIPPNTHARRKILKISIMYTNFGKIQVLCEKLNKNMY